MRLSGRPERSLLHGEGGSRWMAFTGWWTREAKQANQSTNSLQARRLGTVAVL